MHELQIRISCSLGICQEILSDLLSMLAVQHIDAITKTDPNQALSEIFQANPKVLTIIRSLFYPCNHEKIFTSTNTIKSRINISKLDITLIVDILTSVKGFPTYKHMKNLGKCKGADHLVYGKCCIYCNHECQNCKRNPCRKKCCLSGDDRPCNHKCQDGTCQQRYKDCRFDSMTCCSTCQLCSFCGSKNGITQCDMLKLKKDIICFKMLRNAAAHTNEKELKHFEENKFVFVDFPGCIDWESLWETINYAMEDSLGYLCDQKYFQNPLLADDKIDMLTDMQQILAKPIPFLVSQFNDRILDTNKFIVESKGLKEDISSLQDRIGELCNKMDGLRGEQTDVSNLKEQTEKQHQIETSMMTALLNKVDEINEQLSSNSSANRLVIHKRTLFTVDSLYLEHPLYLELLILKNFHGPFPLIPALFSLYLEQVPWPLARSR